MIRSTAGPVAGIETLLVRKVFLLFLQLCSARKPYDHSQAETSRTKVSFAPAATGWPSGSRATRFTRERHADRLDALLRVEPEVRVRGVRGHDALLPTFSSVSSATARRTR